MRRFGLFRDESGAVVVEFALIVPLFMLVVFGVIDFSRAYYKLNTLNSSVREGARYGSTLTAGKYNTNEGRDSVKVAMRTFSTAFGSPIDTSGNRITINMLPAAITVSVTDTFTLLTPLPKYVGRTAIPITRSATFRWERTPTS